MVTKRLPDEPIDRALRVVGGRWKVAILYHLIAGEEAGPKRQSELMRLNPAVSQKVLIQQLREMEEHGRASCCSAKGRLHGNSSRPNLRADCHGALRLGARAFRDAGFGRREFRDAGKASELGSGSIDLALAGLIRASQGYQPLHRSYGRAKRPTIWQVGRWPTAAMMLNGSGMRQRQGNKAVQPQPEDMRQAPLYITSAATRSDHVRAEGGLAQGLPPDTTGFLMYSSLPWRSAQPVMFWL